MVACSICKQQIRMVKKNEQVEFLRSYFRQFNFNYRPESTWRASTLARSLKSCFQDTPWVKDEGVGVGVLMRTTCCGIVFSSPVFQILCF